MNVLNFLRRVRSRTRLWFNLLTCFSYDVQTFYRISNVKCLRKTKSQKIGSLIASYHIIEKGLGMPNRRMGFGMPLLAVLIDECKEYYEEYGNDNSQFAHAVQVVYEYEAFHAENQFELPANLLDKIQGLKALILLEPSHQVSMSKEEFFKYSDSSFYEFSNSRHSIRHFNGPADKDSVLNAITLAQNAPSSCNKQPTGVHYVTNHEKVKNILEEQRGNRGFGQDICSLIVLTTNVSCYSQVGERRSGFVDLGIYTMNLLYALHYYKVGAIPLVWLSDRERDRWLVDTLSISKNEVPVVIIGVGNISDHPLLVMSPRKEIKDVLNTHK